MARCLCPRCKEIIIWVEDGSSIRCLKCETVFEADDTLVDDTGFSENK